jgi:hypothetical protein
MVTPRAQRAMDAARLRTFIIVSPSKKRRETMRQSGKVASVTRGNISSSSSVASVCFVLANHNVGDVFIFGLPRDLAYPGKCGFRVLTFLRLGLQKVFPLKQLPVRVRGLQTKGHWRWEEARPACQTTTLFHCRVGAAVDGACGTEAP